MKTLLSIDEFEKLPEPEQGGGYELDEGEPVYVSPTAWNNAEIIYRIYALLKDGRRPTTEAWSPPTLGSSLPRAWSVPRTLRTSRASEFPILIPSTP